MEQPPRRLGEPLFAGRVLAIAVLQGLSVLAAVLAVYLWSVAGDATDDEVRSVTFATLVLSNLGLILVNRSWRLPVWRAFVERRNPTLKWILSTAVAVLVLLLTVPGLQAAFNFAPMPPSMWLAAMVAAATGVSWFEVYKVARQ